MTFVAKVSSIPSLLDFLSSPILTPAFYIRMLSLLNLALNSLAKLSIDSRSERSNCIKWTSWFLVSFFISSAASIPFYGVLQARMTVAFIWARILEVSLPIPVLAPVTIIIWPERSFWRSQEPPLKCLLPRTRPPIPAMARPAVIIYFFVKFLFSIFFLCFGFFFFLFRGIACEVKRY